MKRSGPDDLVIRKYIDYSLSDKTVLKKELVNFYNKNFVLSRWSSGYFNDFLDDKTEKKMECFVLEKNKKTIGFILGRRVGNIKSRYNLTTLLIDKKFRGKGYSKYLIDEFLKILRKNKSIKKVYLHFRNSNNYEGFYKHCGFGGHRITGTYSNGERKHYMEIKL